MIGQGFSSLPSADSDNIKVTAAYIEAAATARLVASHLDQWNDKAAGAALLRYWQGEAEVLRGRLNASPDASSKRVFVR